MRRTRGQVTLSAVMLGVGALAVTGFSAGVVQAAPRAPERTISSLAHSSRTPGPAGCPANGGRVPAGADVTTTIDLDRDGRADRIWAGDGHYGVRTASGAVASASLANAGGVTVFAQMLTGGVPVLVENGSVAYVSAFVDCSIVATEDPQGGRYEFGLGLTGAGMGYGCVGGADVATLAALRISEGESGSWVLSRAQVDVASDGTRATDRQMVELARYGTRSDATRQLDKLSSTNTCSPETVSQAA